MHWSTIFSSKDISFGRSPAKCGGSSPASVYLRGTLKMYVSGPELDLFKTDV